MRKCKYGQYDETSKSSILEYALLLLDKSLEDLYSDELIKYDLSKVKNKGMLGWLLEELHFGNRPNSRPEPDFPDAGVELKTTPLKIRGGSYVSKERLVLNTINYFDLINEKFETSSFLYKNSSLLLFFYLFKKDSVIDQIFKFIKLWDIPVEDIKTIRKDWEKIRDTVRDGRAEQLSGKDTWYLEACRRGAGGEGDYTAQPNSNEKALRRGFAFKSSYLNMIINDTDEKYQTAIKEDFDQIDIPIVEYFENKFKPYFGWSLDEISQKFNLHYSVIKKDLAASIAKAILNIKPEKQIEEFEKANILMKTIVINEHGRVKESMSFKNIDYDAIQDEEWDSSFFYNDVVDRKYFFVVFRCDEQGTRRLAKVMFWTMPIDMIREAELFWRDIKKKVSKGEFKDFWKLVDHRYFHVRPKGTKEYPTTIMENGQEAPKLAYWINARTIQAVIDGEEDLH